ncbi:hypothetical protein ABET51_14405 [Metabacillus fastidiosus]
MGIDFGNEIYGTELLLHTNDEAEVFFALTFKGGFNYAAITI